jgi:DNA-binding transcriptional regulator/RsmH inhibitor MraZ
MVVPQRLIDYAGLERDVVIAGVTDWIEVWNPAEWTARSSKHGPWSPTVKKDVFGPGTDPVA